MSLFEEMFETVTITRPHPFTKVLSNGETIGQYLRNTGRNEENSNLYDEWVNPTFVSVCLKEMKANPKTTCLLNGLTPNTFAMDHCLGKFTSTKKKTTKRKRKIIEHKKTEEEEFKIISCSPVPLPPPPQELEPETHFVFPPAPKGVQSQSS